MSDQEQPDLTPDPPGGRDADDRAGESADAEGGQVSAVQNLDDAGKPISDSQSVAGQPTAHPVQEGSIGPNAIQPGNAERTDIDHRGKAAPEGSPD